MGRHARDGDRRLNTYEDEERRHQKPAADAEHPRDETNRDAHREDEEDVDGEIGDGEEDLHEWAAGVWIRDLLNCSTRPAPCGKP